MPGEIPTNNPEKREVLDDNARKFTLDGLTPEFLEENKAISYMLVADLIEKSEDVEKKIAYKEFKNDTVQILLIEKVKKDGGIKAVKSAIDLVDYHEYLKSSLKRVSKRRYEFIYEQQGIWFDVKYDEFVDNKLRVLEVDAKSEEARKAFDYHSFPVELTETTGNEDYYGFNIVKVLDKMKL